MRVILLSNVPHYHYLAAGLHRAGYLTRYLTASALWPGENPPFWMPPSLRRKLEGRRLTALDRADVHRIRWPEYLQRLLPMTGLASAERGNWVNNYWFDRVAERLVSECDAFHYVSSVGLYSARRARKAGARIVCDVRQEHPAFQRRILTEESERLKIPAEITGWTFEQKVLDEFAEADRLVVPSQHAKRSFVNEGFDPNRIVSLPYGVDLDHFPHTPPSAGASDSFRVLYVGQITPRKGVHYLLEAWKRFQRPGAELVLIGPMDPAMKPVLAPYEGLYTYAGAVPKLELHRYYATGSVMVMPSLADSFSLVVLEAMACGLPVIVTGNTGAADVVDEGENGFVIPIRDPGAIVERLETLFALPDRTRAMGEAAARRARDYSWRAYEDHAIQIYQAWAAETGAAGTSSRQPQATRLPVL